MKKIMLSFSLLLLSFNVLSQEVNNQKFISVKSMVLESIEQREKILTEEKNCVKKSQQKEQLKDCFKLANEKRKTIGQQIRMKIKQEPQ